MKDLIDERNLRESCARSIVKGYNVHYMTPEELAAQKLANKQQEAQIQVEPATVQEKVFEADERYAHVPSSPYGTTAVQDPVTNEQIRKILGERKENVLETIKEFVE